MRLAGRRLLDLDATPEHAAHKGEPNANNHDTHRQSDERVEGCSEAAGGGRIDSADAIRRHCRTFLLRQA